MDSIVILDDEEDDPQPCSSTSSSSKPTAKETQEASMPAPTHITQSPFASNKKESHILLLENQRLFAEFLEHCAGHTQDCPEVMTFLRAKHAKASPEFLSSVEFRNTLGRCLTRAQASRAKTFVFINELCTVLKQHSARRRQATVPLPAQEPPPPSPLPPPSPGNQAAQGPADAEADQEPPSTSGQGEEKKVAKASRRQIAYLENLLKVYYEEIHRLQEKDLSLEDMMQEDSGYIQEHKLKRKMMKIYDKLCELKGCSTLTGRVIEQRVPYSGTRYPEINRKVERFINGPEARMNPPDYSDILAVVQRANERYALALSRKQLAQIAQDAFRETGNQLQERRHLDMVYNFGSHLTDCYRPASDPALTDPALARKLRSNRELALTSLDQVINKYAMKQDDTEEEERKKRLEREKTKKEALAAQKDEEMKNQQEEEKEVAEKEVEEEEEEGGDSEDEEEGDEEDEVSSDPDIEEELQASQSQEGADDEEDEEEEANASEEEDLESGLSPSSDQEAPIGVEENGDEGSQSASSSRGEAAADKKGGPTLSSSPSQSGAPTSPDAGLAAGEPVSPNHTPAVLRNANEDARSATESPALDSSDRACSPPASEPQESIGSPAPPSPVVTEVTPDSKKRRRTSEASTVATVNGRHKHSDGDSDITLDMGVVTSSPLQADSTQADSPTQEPVSSSECTPPPKKKKVNVSTQCDPDEVIILSDSD
ncbi:hypothetical protein ANANG_G00184180 [Anguilla anguilla]|uniref:Death domain-associated protein 6 n=1 Tax=Anguilla anguilla TaxID=7936 RepID=A0A9D3M5T2_ANGAN|nr:hypothetical protein ANANG_G00184180 [Anguilla anguilla]